MTLSSSKLHEGGLRAWCARALFLLALALSALTHGTSARAATQSHGPLASSVTSTSARLWTRTDSAGEVVLAYATEPDLSSATFSGPVVTVSNSDFTATVEISGLQPLTTYYYCFFIDGVSAQTAPFPQFTTAPFVGAHVDFSFAILADLINTNTSSTVAAPAYSALATEDPAFVLHLGDFDHRNPTSGDQMRKMRRDTRGPETASGADFADFIAPFFPLYYVWDDHDFGVNNADKTWSKKADSLRVYSEYFPTELVNPNAGVWHSIVYGNVEVFMLDTRAQRDVNTTPDGEEKSILDGDEIANGQKDWLFDGLVNSRARWKIIATGSPFNPGAKPDDGWGAFMHERTELLDWIDANQIEGVFVLSGDLHTGGAIDDGTNSGLPEVSVPHTNLITNQQATGQTGTWSEGRTSGRAGGGYALVTISDSPAEALLEVKDATGSVRHSFALSVTENPPDTVRIIRAQYDAANGRLSVIATSNDPDATLTVQGFGTMTLAPNGRHRGTWPTPANPGAVLVTSDGGGSASTNVIGS